MKENKNLEKFIELYWDDDCSDEELEKEFEAIKAYLKTLKGDKDNGEER